MHFPGDNSRMARMGPSSTLLLGFLTFLAVASSALARAVDVDVDLENSLAAGHPSNEGPGQGQGHLQLQDLHPIDVCIYSCDLCFKSEALVHCANACILSEGAMDRDWRRICTVFDGPHQHPHYPALGFL